MTMHATPYTESKSGREGLTWNLTMYSTRIYITSKCVIQEPDHTT